MSLRSLAATLALCVVSAVTAGSASAAPAAAHWQIFTQAAPTYFHAGDSNDFYEVVAVNDGGAPAGASITLRDELAPGLKVVSVIGSSGVKGVVEYNTTIGMPCTIVGGPAEIVECTPEEPVPIGARVGAKIIVEVPAQATGALANTASIGGGGAPAAATTNISTPVVDPSTPVPYGVSLAAAATAEDGTPATQAGSRPFSFSTILATNVARVEAAENCGPPGNFATSPGCAELVAASKDIEVELPPGLVGNAQNVPRCRQEQFQSAFVNAGCPADTQVGGAYLAFFGAATAEQYEPIYNVEPPPGQPAEFGFIVGGQARVPMFFHVRSDGTYGLTVKLGELTSFDTPRMAELSIWGVPAVSAHDEKRQSLGTCETNGTEIGCPAGAPVKPLLRLPTSCSSSPLEIAARSDSWQRPGAYVGALPQPEIGPMGGCGSLRFEPLVQARPTTDVADSPTGLHVDIHVPQIEDPQQPATPDLRDAVVKLPPGLTLNPSAANGLEACTPAQFGLTSGVGVVPIETTAAPAECPAAAKIGTVEVDTALLDHPLPGAVYVAQPYQNPFGSLLAIYVAVDDPVSGVVIKLAGRVEIGDEGQLTTTFTESPQLPFDDFKLDFFGGEHAALKTPAVCAHYDTTTTLTPWSAPASGPAATPGDAYDVSRQPGGGSCPSSAGAAPVLAGFEAGSETPLAGAFSPFVVHLTRPDGSQQFSSLTIAPPPGLLGRLAGIPYCPDAALAAAGAKSGIEERAAPSCPAASRVGSVVVGAGAGPGPYHVAGTAYLAGPYKGAPLSLAIVTPAVAGPYDLGNVVVRAALEVDPETTQITVKSDPMPTQLKGIPLDIRSVVVKMDRPDFTLNPTSCEAMAVGGSVSTTQGATAPLSNRFQVGSCNRLRFKPRLALRVFGKTGRNAKPRLRAVLRMNDGEADIARARVNLPHSEFLEQAHIKTICTRVQFAADSCPKDSIYGHARAVSPLLDQPLEGPVYLRSSAHKLPDLVAALDGQIDVVLAGRVDSGKNGGLRNTFEVVPDAPVSTFILELRGGKNGLLVNSENLCSPKAERRAIVHLTAHNGKVRDFRPLVQNGCHRQKGKRQGHR
jgi:hypothetical protein